MEFLRGFKKLEKADFWERGDNSTIGFFWRLLGEALFLYGTIMPHYERCLYIYLFPYTRPNIKLTLYTFPFLMNRRDEYIYSLLYFL